MTAQLLLMLALVGADESRPLDFATEIVPVLTRAGCNTGACHGAAAGRGGFNLSLFGGDPRADYAAIVLALEGRRVNLARPSESLILNKPTGSMRHGGGTRLDPDGVGAKRLEAWIAGGAKRAKNPRTLGKLVVRPAASVVTKVSDEVALSALASFDSGPAEDVTAWTVFTSTDPAAVTINDRGTAVVRRRGQHVVVARFLERVVPVSLTLPFADDPIDLTQEPRASFIDEEVLRTLEVLRIPVAPRATDAEFLRRARLDLTGRLPSVAEVKKFVEDQAADKRARLIDDLLASDDFVQYWTFKLAALFRNRPQPADIDGAKALHAWLRQALHDKLPYDRLARQLLTSVGDTHKVGPAYFTRLANDPRQHAELVSQVFMGARLQCANCHNHPLDRWTQDDYHGLAAVFAQLERGPIVKVTTRGAVTHPRTGEAAVPRIPGWRFLDAPGDARAALADWLTANENPHFARAIVNRLWCAMFGRGLVDPTDDLRETNPATHPALLERLAADFIQHGFDLRHTLRLIATSATYGRGGETTTGNRADDRFYSHAYRRPLEPEVLVDAIADVTGVAEKLGNEPLGTRALALVDAGTPSRALDALGRCARREACAEGAAAATLPAMLHRLNGPLVNGKISATDGRLHKLIAAGKSNEEIIDEFYLRCFARALHEDEKRFWQTQSAGLAEQARTEWLEDVVWALLNGREFTNNH